MDPWKRFQAEQAQFARLRGDYDFSIYTQPKQRGHGHSKIATRTWEKTVAESAEEQAPRLIPGGRLGLEVLFLSTKPVGDLDNCIKSLSDALNRRAWHDDRAIDWINAVRIYGPEVEENRILARVRERGNG